MKITVEIDCTPEEARRAMGVPDVAALQEAYLSRVMGLSEGGMKPEMIETLIKGWSPLGEAGMGIWRALMDGATKDVGTAKRDDGR